MDRLKIDDLTVCFREMRPDDLNLVRDSWIESFRTAHAAGTLPDSLYWPAYREAIRRLLARSHVIIAFNQDNEKQDFGWIAFERGSEPLVHYIFVKSFFRRNRLATELMHVAGFDPSQPFVYTHKTLATSKLKSWAGQWIPSAARREPKDDDTQDQKDTLP